MIVLLFILFWSGLFAGVGYVLFMNRKSSLYIYALIGINFIYLCGIFVFVRLAGYPLLIR